MRQAPGLVAVLVLASCSARMPASRDQVVRVAGDLFLNGDYVRTPFDVSGDTAKSIHDAASGGARTMNMKWQGLAAFTIYFADGSSCKVEVPHADAIRIDGRAYKMEKAVLVRILREVEAASQQAENGT